MKKIILFAYMSFFTTISMASTSVQTGQIIFTGQIIDTTCDVTEKGDVVCYRRGKYITDPKKLRSEFYTEKKVKIDENKIVRIISYL